MNNVASHIKKIDFENEFIIDDINGKSYTYSEFFAQALSVASLLDKNHSNSDVIAILNNSYELALLYFSVMLTNKRIIVIDPQKGREEIESILSEISPSVIYVDGGIQIDTKKHILADLALIEKIDVSNYVEDVKKSVLHYLNNREKKQPYLVTFTSGTSGLPKGVEHSLDNLFLSAIALDHKVQKRNGTILHVMPMTYMAGILNSLIYPFLTGNRIVICKRFSILLARDFWKKVEKYGVDLFWISPSMLMMIDKMDRSEIGEKYCKDHQLVFLVGTAPLSNETRKRFLSRYPVKLYASYGLSETLFISVETEKTLAISEINCVGELLDGVRYKFKETGEMLLDVDWMYLGYTNKNTSDYFEGSYYKSGDIAEIDKECLYITGRSKDLIIKGGLNISPGLIEEVIYSDPRIAENVVLGVDIDGEERVCCAYTTSDAITNIQTFENEIKKLVIDRLGKSYALDFMRNMEIIPKNINGKIDKTKIREFWEQNV